MGIATTAVAQNTCNYSIRGTVLDAEQHPVIGAIVRMDSDMTKGAVTDTNGRYVINGLCKGHMVLQCNALGYAPVNSHLHITGNDRVDFLLNADKNDLQEVVVNGVRMQDLHTVAHTDLKGLALLQTRGGSLGDALKEIPGLNAIQTGPSISKPVIHGLHSNRVLIMNNGVRQEGQQWGSEHAPEIDPFVANHITVVKGAASVRYGSDAIGGVVLLNPDDLPAKPGISGDVYLVGATNGQVGTVSASLQGAFDKKLKCLSWRVQGTLKEAGNFHTPHYYLINTGLKEGDFSANVAYKWRRFDFDLFYSQYNTQMGIFIGAESGNPAELITKFSLSSPGLPSYFTYNISRPYQVVNHELVRGIVRYNVSERGKVELILGRQNDRRREYDDLSVSTIADPSLPQLSFQLVTHSANLIYTQGLKNGWSGSFGLTGITSGNVFEGVRYLIPNFRDYNSGAFAIERYNLKKFSFEAGLRYDYRWLRVYQRNQTTLDLYNTTYQYRNFTGTTGATYHVNQNLSASMNIGTAWRAPSINEMYINGEHFSDASFQVGDSTLKSERSLNSGLSVTYSSHKLRIGADMYYNRIANYIYAKPSLKVRQLPSGTFPEFDYTQANVAIRGLDATVQYDVLSKLSAQSKVTIVRGFNRSIDDWLIYMPCDRYENSVNLHTNKVGMLNAPYVSVENVSVIRQSRVPPNSDFVPPPGGYSLFNAHIGGTFPIRGNALTIDFAINNIMNVAYRDYLNRFRYYADELGTNFVLRLKFSFNSKTSK